MSNKDDYESDDSLSTEELNELQTVTKVYGGIERSSAKKPKDKAKKPEEPAEIELEPLVTPEPEKKPRGRPKKEKLEKVQSPRPKRPRGRPPGSYTDKTKIERVVYLAPDMKGGYERVQVKQLTKKQLSRVENEAAVDEEEMATKQKFLRTVDGSKDQRQKKQRTPAQVEATRKLVENRRRALEAKKAEKEKNKSEEQEQIKQTVQEAVIETVTEPIDDVKKRMQERRAARAVRQKSSPIDIPKRKTLTFD